jgi:hypothetical protein
MSSPHVGPRIFTAVCYRFDTANQVPVPIVSPDEIVWEDTWIQVSYLDPEKKGGTPMCNLCITDHSVLRSAAVKLFGIEQFDTGLFVQAPSVVFTLHAGVFRTLERYARRQAPLCQQPQIRSLVDEAYSEPITIEQRRAFTPEMAAHLLLLDTIPPGSRQIMDAINHVVFRHVFFEKS